jgi:Ion channel
MTRALAQRFAAMRKHGMLVLLLLLVTTVFVVPAFLTFGRTGRLVLDVLITLVLLTGFFAAIGHRRIVRMLAVLSVLAIAIRWTEWIVPFALLPALRELSSMLALIALAVAVGVNVFGAGKDIATRLIGAIVLYLLIGLVCAVGYAVVHAYTPGAFGGAVVRDANTLDQWVYFSFVTLTTLGYGDVTPVTSAARSLAILEALVGQLYPAIIIARLVSLPLDGPSR